VKTEAQSRMHNSETQTILGIKHMTKTNRTNHKRDNKNARLCIIEIYHDSVINLQ